MKHVPDDDVQKDTIGKAIDAVDEKEEQKTLKADVQLTDGRRIVLVVPHPFGPDDFESAVVTLLQMRAASEAQVEAAKPILVPKGPKLVDPTGRPIS